MTDFVPDIAEVLRGFLARVQAPRALTLHAAAQTVLTRAVERAQTQLLSGPEPVLVVALAGCTGAGKSALTNALAGAVIAEMSDKRPTTTRLRVYHHRDTPSGGLPVELASVATFVPHDRPELRTKVIIDTPDLDSFATEHRDITRQVLKAAGLTLYVFSPEKYLEERTWSIVREEQHFSASAAVLNKADQVTLDELEQITEDLRQRFTEISMKNIRIFRTCALAHLPRAAGTAALSAPVVDDTLALRTFLERELQGTDVARMRREQQQRILAHLRDEVERVAPTTTLALLDDVAEATAQLAMEATSRCLSALSERLHAVEEEFAALATLQQHARFRGPLRSWLLAADCLRFGLKRLGYYLAGGAPQAEGQTIAALLTRGPTTAMDDLLREAAHSLQNLLYRRNLPVEHWHNLTASLDGAGLLAEIAADIEARFFTATSTQEKRGDIVIRLASSLGTAIPAVLVTLGVFVTTRDLIRGEYVGLPLLGHLLAMGGLFFLALQGGANLLLPGAPWRGQEMVHQAVQQVITTTLERWLITYRRDLEADLRDLRAPLDALQEAMAIPEEPLDSTLVRIP